MALYHIPVNAKSNGTIIYQPIDLDYVVSIGQFIRMDSSYSGFKIYIKIGDPIPVFISNSNSKPLDEFENHSIQVRERLITAWMHDTK